MISEYFKYLENLSLNFTPNKVLDIGAFVGEFSLTCKYLWNNCEPLMIEANPLMEKDLKKTRFPYMIECLGDTERVVDFYVPLDAESISQSGSSYYKENTSYFDNFKIKILKKTLKKLDDITDDTFDIIKIDTQGSELDIINGGFKTIQKSKVVVIECSVIEYNQNSPSANVIIEKMKDLGFNHSTIVHSWTWNSDMGNKYKNGEIIQHDVLFTK